MAASCRFSRFFEKKDGVPVPEDWSRNIVSGKGYSLAREPGLGLWREVLEKLHRQGALRVAESGERYGTPSAILPRLGQGTFRVEVMEAYRRRRAVTGEKVLPVLEAAHMRSYAEGGKHRVDNGLPPPAAFLASLHHGDLNSSPLSNMY